MQWYRKAAGQGYAEVQYNLGGTYARGVGVEKDEVEAYKWYLLAAAQGDAKAKGHAPHLESLLTPEQITEGKRRADQFKPQQRTHP